MAEFRALGPLEAVVAGRPVDLGAPKQRKLVALLVSRVGQPVPVDVMLEALWAESPPPSAMTSLQSYVANLRRALEPGRAPRTPTKVLHTNDRGYLLDGHAVEVDVHRFERRAKAGWQAWNRGDPHEALSEFEAGLALWRGEAYTEVSHSVHVAAEVARLGELRLSAVEGRCAALLAVGAHEVAVAELEAFMQAHPLREYGCELLSLALYRAGRQADALAVLRTNQRRLGDELGIDPRPALQHLEREILSHAPALDWRPAQPVPVTATPRRAALAARTPLPAPDTGEEIFVGREESLRHLAAVSAEAAGGRGQVVTVSGEPGIGKTTLLRRFTELATGAPVLWGACPGHVATPPLWPWRQVLGSAGTHLPRRPVPGPVAEVLNGETRQPPSVADADAVTLRQFEAIVHYLTRASHARPLVIVLDHLHQADPASLQLLAHLAESVRTSRLLVAASYRSDAAAALATTSAALARADMTQVELSGLDVAEARALASAMLHREVSGAAAEELRYRTGGNPFYLRELIKVLDGDESRGGTASVPAPVREVVLGRVAQLCPEAVELLSVAAVAGRSFAVDVVAEASSIEIEEALRAVDTIVAAGLIREDPQRLGWYSFTHALTAEVLYQTIGRLRRVHLLRRIRAAAVRPRKTM
ncbi:BTAD domain-containing putative transcriptional regulator [Streptomyces sp. P17]|uniref:BTAD domain-containing putative transcriptional regulator n=1 Tax=Streptomyces sp. P17 TaxID=3074716 RepID=UPI0028F3FB3A|nr:BTAD domain-containing putative transcriptional regulator [Streptomyces sp. P17]MDT9701057.1 BTAD domain-containing putative transcriptional regulator [Streptomyces sp. P17]